VVDVRRNPVSRKKGFSRTALSEFLCSNAIEYVHVSALGVPQPLRAQLRDGRCDLSEYLAEFSHYVRKELDAVEHVYNLATHRRCCLLCVEECVDDCHRSVVAKEVASQNGHKLKIVHV
jgi:uncharacterized protein (DUF488 family)